MLRLQKKFNFSKLNSKGTQKFQSVKTFTTFLTPTFRKRITSIKRLPSERFNFFPDTTTKQHKNIYRNYHSSRITLQRDFYEILGVSKTASKQTIKSSFYKIAKQYHPDSNKNDPSAVEKFKEASNAYEVLSDDEKRKKYDQYGHEAFDPNSFHSKNIDPEEILKHFGFSNGLGEFFGFSSSPYVLDEDIPIGQDVHIKHEINFLESFKGSTKEISFEGNVECKTCRGSGAQDNSKKIPCTTCSGTGQKSKSFFGKEGPCETCSGEGSTDSNPCQTCSGNGVVHSTRKVKMVIPEGIESGTTLRLVGESGIPRRGGKPGDVFVQIQVVPHPIFYRNGLDVHVEVPIKLSQAILGGKVRTPTLTGEVEIKIPTGTQANERRVIKGKGFKKFNSSEVGNFYIHFNVIIPKVISPFQKQLIEEFAKQEEGLPKPSRSHFEKLFFK